MSTTTTLKINGKEFKFKWNNRTWRHICTELGIKKMSEIGSVFEGEVYDFYTILWIAFENTAGIERSAFDEIIDESTPWVIAQAAQKGFTSNFTDPEADKGEAKKAEKK